MTEGRVLSRGFPDKPDTRARKQRMVLSLFSYISVSSPRTYQDYQDRLCRLRVALTRNTVTQHWGPLALSQPSRETSHHRFYVAAAVERGVAFEPE